MFIDVYKKEIASFCFCSAKAMWKLLEEYPYIKQMIMISISLFMLVGFSKLQRIYRAWEKKIATFYGILYQTFIVYTVL